MSKRSKIDIHYTAKHILNAGLAWVDQLPAKSSHYGSARIHGDVVSPVVSESSRNQWRKGLAQKAKLEIVDFVSTYLANFHVKINYV